MMKPDHKERVGSDKFEGFLVDLLNEIAHKLNFQFELYKSPDGNYGSRTENGSWNGMIKELIEGVKFVYCVFLFHHIPSLPILPLLSPPSASDSMNSPLALLHPPYMTPLRGQQIPQL